MSPDEANIILSTMRAMWPNHELDAQQVAVWVRRLAKLNYDDVNAGLAVLDRVSKFWPAYAELAETVEPITRRRVEADNAERLAIPSGRPCTREENQAWLAKCRDILANARGPLAKTLARTIGVSTPPPSAQPPDRYQQGRNLASLPEADARTLAATLADPLDRQAFLKGWTDAQEGAA